MTTKSEDLFDNVEIVSFEDLGSEEPCLICNGICQVSYEGELQPSDNCTGECGHIPDIFDIQELNFE